MLTIQEVNSAIMLQTWTNTELNSMIDAVKWNRANLAKRVKHSIVKGSTVKFTSSRSGQMITGTVEKVAIKYATVRTPLGGYRVPMNMLESA